MKAAAFTPTASWPPSGRGAGESLASGVREARDQTERFIRHAGEYLAMVAAEKRQRRALEDENRALRRTVVRQTAHIARCRRYEDQLDAMENIDQGAPGAVPHTKLYKLREYGRVADAEVERSTTCIACRSCSIDTVFIACRHSVVCQRCSKSLKPPNRCPVCRRDTTCLPLLR